MKTKLCWRLLVKCHNLNKSIIKGCSTSYATRIYAQKELLLEECVQRIIVDGCKIKCGYQLCDTANYPYILYFEYNGKQVSFHSYKSFGLPVFKGEWCGYRQGLLSDHNGKIPAKNVRKKTH